MVIQSRLVLVVDGGSFHRVSGGVVVADGWWHTVYSSAAPEAEFKATVILHGAYS